MYERIVLLWYVKSEKRMGRKMEWAGRAKHLGGMPRKMVFMAVGGFAKAVANILNTTAVGNADTLLHLVQSRPPRVPLITVSNHMSTYSFFLFCLFNLLFQLLKLLVGNVVKCSCWILLNQH